MAKQTKVFGVKIKTGAGEYRWLTGWDDWYASRADAKACAERANRKNGWSAKVVSAPREPDMQVIDARR